MIKVNYFLRLFNYFLTAVSANYVFTQPAPEALIISPEMRNPDRQTQNQQVGNLSEHARRKSIWRHILGVFRGFIWF